MDSDGKLVCMKPQVGDDVWYVVGNDREQARIIGIEGTTHVRIRLMTGKQKGQKLRAPWGIVHPLKKKTTESYRGWAIELIIWISKDGTFMSEGFIRMPNRAGTGLPIEESFDTSETGGEHPTEDAAIKAGISFAKKKIDSNWKAVGK